MTHRLQKGENIVLNTVGDLVISTEWQTKTINPPLEIDVSAFLLNNDKVTSDADFIFYNQPRSLTDAVLLKDRRFKINLKQLAPDINRIAFVLSIHEALHRKHSFASVDNIHIKVFDFLTRQEIINYHLDGANGETAIILATLYYHQNTWKFRAVGQGYESGLSVLVQNFGVTIESEPMPALTPPELSDKQPLPNKTNKIMGWFKDKFIADSKVTDNFQKTPDIHPHTEHKIIPKKLKQPKPAQVILADSINIHDTDALTLDAQYEPITRWFKHKYISVEVNPSAMDTTGFFDEIAVALGDNYEVLKIVSNKIKYRQLNNKEKAYIELADMEAKNSEKIKQFCKELYDYSFVAKYFYNQQKKLITLHLQSAPRIVRFFTGEWLEWYVFMKIVDYCHQRQLGFSCTRNMRIDTIHGHYEIDIFFLINDTPLFIECKSGEYRQFIDKYCKLRKQLTIDKSHFIFLIADMNESKSKGLTAMFDITFINAEQLNDYLTKIV